MKICQVCKQEIKDRFIAKTGIYWHLICQYKEQEPASPSDVISIVKQMRAKQRAYFQTRSKQVLRESITLEREVDELLEFYKPCPSCKRESFQDPCFQFMFCDFCSYCIHPSVTGGVCDSCGEVGK